MTLCNFIEYVCVLCVQIAKSFWKAWQDFEVRHGNEDTFREMLRIKRSVQAQFSTQVNFVSVQMLAAAAGQEGTKTGKVDNTHLYIHPQTNFVKIHPYTSSIHNAYLSYGNYYNIIQDM